MEDDGLDIPSDLSKDKKNNHNDISKSNKIIKEKDYEFKAYTICLILSFSIGFVLKIFDSAPLDDYQKYLEIFITVIGAIIGLIFVVIIFYLGKKHDYKKDFTKNYAELTEYLTKYERQVSKWETEILKIDKLQKQLPVILNNQSNDVDNYDLSSSLKNMKSNLKSMQEQYEGINKLTIKVLKSTKETPRDLLHILAPFIIGMTLSFIYTNNSFGDLYFLISFLIVGIASFVLSWNMEEHKMNLLHDMFNDLVQSKVRFKIFILDIEANVQLCKEMHNEVNGKIDQITHIQDNIKKYTT